MIDKELPPNLVVYNNKHFLHHRFCGSGIRWGSPQLRVSQAIIKVSAGVQSSRSLIAVGKPQVLTGYWLEASVPCHMGNSQHDSWLRSEKKGKRRY